MLVRFSNTTAQSLRSRRCLASAATNVSHTVFNQAHPFTNIDMVKSDPALITGIQSIQKNYPQTKIDWDHLNNFGKKSGTQEMMETSELAEKNRPVLKQFDNFGRRIDVAEYHNAYHVLMKHGLSHGCAGYGFKQQGEAHSGSQVMRAALIYLENQLEAGHCCPIVMTAAAIPVFQRVAHIPWIQSFIDKILVQDYDPSNAPIEHKKAVTIGMSMTEKQGGSDVRANTTMAKPVKTGETGIGAAYHLVGHKWFTSAPMCDGFLTLAKTDPNKDHTSCFLVPRWLPDGTRNTGFSVMRLKDKLADRANASSEVEYHNAWAMMIGEEGKGVKTIIEMVQSTRLDCTLGSAGGARRAVQIALNHANSRNAFGKKLVEQPLMQNLLTDLCVEAEAHTMTGLRMAAAFDAYYNGNPKIVDCDNVEEAQELFRIGVSVSKYYVTKRLPQFTFECMEAMGGNGFVEDFQMARLFRHSPLNSIWEGSGNVIALDILRGAKAIPTLLKDIKRAKGMDSSLDQYVKNLEKNLFAMAADPLNANNQRAARNVMDRLAVSMQASILLRMGDPQVAKAYIAAHIAHNDNHGVNYGGNVVYDGNHSQYIIDRNMPVFLK